MVLMMIARHKVIILSRAVGFGGATVPSWRSLEYRTVTRSVIFVKKIPCWYTKIIPRSSHPKNIFPPPSHPPGASHIPMSPWAFVQAAHFRHEFGVDICRSCAGVPSWKYPGFYRSLLMPSTQPTQPCLLRLALYKPFWNSNKLADWRKEWSKPPVKSAAQISTQVSRFFTRHLWYLP